jgi:arylsulfatase A-like enzyme
LHYFANRGLNMNRIVSQNSSPGLVHFACGLVLATGLLQASVAFGDAVQGWQPNFVFILIDDLGWTDLGCYGSTFYETPNIDKLARQGMRFTNAYAACPVCSPTRASIMTGRYPARLHLTDYIPGQKRPYEKLQVPKFRQELPLEELTLAEALKTAGYVSAAVGKWHLGGKGFLPQDHGFDVNFAGDHRGQPPSYFSPYQIPGTEASADGEYLTDRLTQESERFIEQNRDKPFFLYLAHYGVHTPLQAKKEVIAKYQAKVKPGQAQNNATYAAMIESVDDSVGRIMAKLDELRIAERTVVIFMSDNGGLERSTSNAPLRAGKGTAYEGGVREPMIVRWPGIVEPGSIRDVPVISVDFFPTILQIAGVKMDAQRVVDGLSLVPLLKQAAGINRDVLYWHYPHYHITAPFGSIRQGNYKLIEYYEDGRLELYDLKEDLGEKSDLAAKMPGKAAELREKLHDWLRSVKAQMPTPNPNYDPAKAAKRPR